MDPRLDLYEDEEQFFGHGLTQFSWIDSHETSPWTLDDRFLTRDDIIS